MKAHLIIRYLFRLNINDLINKQYAEWTNLDKHIWNFLKWIFGKKYSYRLLGNRDIAFTGKGCDTSLIPEALHKSFTQNTQSRSFFVHLLLNGHLKQMEEDYLPISLKKSFLKKVKQNLSRPDLRIEYINSDLLEHIQSFDIPRKTFLSVSDILSFVSEEYMIFLLNRLLKNGSIENGVVIRSFLRHRQNGISGILNNYFNPIDISHLDPTNMYQVMYLSTQPYAD